jgi:hypothetical protein
MTYQRWDNELAFIYLKKKIIDPSEGINKYITAINAEKAATDLTNYGRVLAINNIILPNPTTDISTNDPGAVFMLTAGQYAMNYNPFIILSLETGGFNITADGPSTITTLHPSIYINFSDPGDGSVDILAFRYVQAFKDLIEATRWQDPLINRINDLAVMDYTAQNKSWREVGLSIAIESASK